MLTHLLFAGQREGVEVAPTRGFGEVFGGLAGVFLVEFEVSSVMVVLTFLVGYFLGMVTLALLWGCRRSLEGAECAGTLRDADVAEEVVVEPPSELRRRRAGEGKRDTQGELLHRFTVEDLRRALRYRNLPVGGLKADLVCRMRSEGPRPIPGPDACSAVLFVLRRCGGRPAVEVLKGEAGAVGWMARKLAQG